MAGIGSNDIDISIGTDNTEVMKAIEDLGKQISELPGVAASASGGMGEALTSLMNPITSVAFAFNQIKDAVETTFEGIVAAIKPAYNAVEDFRLYVFNTASMMASLQGDQEHAVENYEKAKAHVEALIPKMQELESHSNLGLKHYQETLSILNLQGVSLDGNNEKQLRGLDVLTKLGGQYSHNGADMAMYNSEIRLALEGQTGARSRLGQMLQGMVDGPLKKEMEMHQKNGDLLEWFADKFPAITAATHDLEGTFSAIHTSFETFVNGTLRQGFTQAYDQINNKLREGMDWLRAHKEIISNGIHKAWLATSGILETIGHLLGNDGIKATLQSVLWVVGQIANGFGGFCYVFLPEIFKYVESTYNILSKFPVMALQFGNFMLDAMGMVLEKVGQLAHVVWDLIFNRSHLDASLKAASQQSTYGDKMKQDGVEFKLLTDDIVSNVKSMYGTLDRMGDRAVEWQAKIKEGGKDPGAGKGHKEEKGPKASEVSGEAEAAKRLAEEQAQAELNVVKETEQAKLNMAKQTAKALGELAVERLKGEQNALDALHKADIIKDEEYYAKKLILMDKETEAKDAVYKADIAANESATKTQLAAIETAKNKEIAAIETAAAKETGAKGIDALKIKQIEEQRATDKLKATDKFNLEKLKLEDKSKLDIQKFQDDIKKNDAANMAAEVKVHGEADQKKTELAIFWNAARSKQIAANLTQEREAIILNTELIAKMYEAKFGTAPKEITNGKQEKDDEHKYAVEGNVSNTEKEYEEKVKKVNDMYTQMANTQLKAMNTATKSAFEQSKAAIDIQRQQISAEEGMWNQYYSERLRAGKMSETQYQQAKKQVQDTFDRQRDKARHAVIKSELDMSKQAAQGVSDFFTAMTAVVGAKNKEMFYIMKGVKAAQTIISTASGVMDAIDGYPPYLNMAMAGIVAATGALQLATIMSTDDSGSGGSISTPPSAPSAPSQSSYNPSSSATSQPTASSQQGWGGTTIVNINGPTDKEYVHQTLIPLIEDAAGMNRTNIQVNTVNTNTGNLR